MRAGPFTAHLSTGRVSAGPAAARLILRVPTHSFGSAEFDRNGVRQVFLSRWAMSEPWIVPMCLDVLVRVSIRGSNGIPLWFVMGICYYFTQLCI